ncbi:sensor histidine kinase [Paenibacillus methanolicus]|uniref:Two-component system sensor histidine kinase YesM n=1 Tax=Paenibacillus methanolicus TaxID=582686 RepID=A0A5S5C5U3_9BACL|nr:sensor histidine kinase [Paenibacillus methanolicus]TYP74805.1 two-component system sensor histidine kinase YesM [Paenibacillus methanolicus]
MSGQLRRWLRPLRFKRVNRQIFVLTIVVITLPMTLMSGIIYLFTLQAVKSEYQSSATLILNNLSFNIDQYLQSIEKGTLTAQLDNRLQESLASWLLHPEVDVSQSLQYGAVIEQFVSTIEMTIKNVDSVQIYSGGRVFYSANFDRSSYQETNFMNETWYKQTLAAKGKIVIFGTHTPFRRTSDEERQKVISIARVINKTGTKQPLGVMLVDIRLDSLREILALSENSNHNFLIVDNKGGYVYASGMDENGGGAGTDGTVLAQVRGSETGSFYAPMSGERAFFNFVSSPYSGWKVIQYIEEREMTKDAERLRLILLVFAFCTLGVALLFLFLLSVRVTKPIILLSRQVRAVGLGNLDVQLKSDRSDEFGVLYNGIRKMTEDLKAHIERASMTLAQQRMAQYGALKSQINPHFLANALESIQMKAVIAGQRDIGEMVGLLGRLFRRHIQTGKEVVPLNEELANIRLYIKVQQMRFGDKLRYDEQLAPGTEQTPVLHFALQPIIENAIVHGLERRSGSGRLTVETEVEGTLMRIIVRDDGAGMSEERLAAIRSRLAAPSDTLDMDHIGIKNVHDRIRYYFGERYGVDVHSAAGEGTRVVIRVPASG